MISYKKLACFLSTFLLLSLPMFGQYTATYSAASVDVLNSTYSPISGYNCVTANCWNELPSSTSFAQLSASSDGEVQTIDGSGYRWRWSISSQTWSKVTGDSLQGTYKAIHVGSYANNHYLAITTATSGGNVYYWTGSAWAHLGTNWECADGAMTPDGTIYCIGTQGNTYQWTTGGWVDIRNADGATIAANGYSAALVNTSGNIYLWDPEESTWTEATGLGFTPSTAIGSIGIADDDTISVLGSEGNVRISHDGGNSWTEVNHSGLTMGPVTSGFANNTFSLTSAGQVYHLNTMLPATGYTLAGSCGSACIPNSAVTIMFTSGNELNSQFVCPTGWNSDGNSDCYFETTANVNLNATSFAAGVNCDSFAPGSSCQTPYTISIVVTANIVGVVLSSSTDCDCEWHEEVANQKYYVTSSNYNTAPSGGLWGIAGLFGVWAWPNTTMDQWCTSVYIPNLGVSGVFNVPVSIVYIAGHPKPTAMPGRYVNGDVVSFANSLLTDWYPSEAGGIWRLRVYASGEPGEIAGNIYTWNNYNPKRGPNGSPTTPCQGYKLN